MPLSNQPKAEAMKKPTSGRGLTKAPPQPRRFSLTSRFKSGLLLAGRRPAAVRLGLEPATPRRR